MCDWNSFIPNLLSTLFGVFGGFFSSLYIENRNKKIEDTQNLKNKNQDLFESLNSLLEILSWNRGQLISLIETFNVDAVKISFQTDLLSWDALKNSILNNLRNITIKTAILRHFSNLYHLTNTYNNYYHLYSELLLNPQKSSNFTNHLLERNIDYLKKRTPEVLDELDKLNLLISQEVKN